MSVLLSEGFFCMSDSIRRRFPAEARSFPLFSEGVKEALHVGEEAVLAGGCFGGEDGGV